MRACVRAYACVWFISGVSVHAARKSKSRHVVDCWMDERGRPVEAAERFSWQEEREHNLDCRPPPLTLGQCSMTAYTCTTLETGCGLTFDSFMHIQAMPQ